MSKEILRKVWHNMKKRCYSKNDKSYYKKGIKVCDEWLGENGFINFYNWAMANGYKEEKGKNGYNILTLDRIDNNGNYEPNNCRWITNEEQQYNKSNNIHIKYNGKDYTIDKLSKKLNLPKTTISTRFRRNSDLDKPYIEKKERYFIYQDKEYSLTELVKISGLKRSTLYKRLVKLKWDVEKAINQKDTKIRTNLKYCEYNGKQYSLIELSKMSGISRDVLYRRIIELNWSVEKALNQNLRKRQKKVNLYKYNGSDYTLQELSEILNIPKGTLYYRIKNNLNYNGTKKESKNESI